MQMKKSFEAADNNANKTMNKTWQKLGRHRKIRTTRKLIKKENLSRICC